jgi:hypothetical protein
MLAGFDHERAILCKDALTAGNREFDQLRRLKVPVELGAYLEALRCEIMAGGTDGHDTESPEQA